MPALVQPLPQGPLDIVGDVHGEVEALSRLLRRLGCDPERLTAERPIVFVGDLVDRGPDSVAVVTMVRRLVETGLAHCVIGNHELNLLVDDAKQGNGWYFRDPSDGYPLRDASGQVSNLPFPSVMAEPAQADDVLRFLKSLPLALERTDLRVVHACWDADALADLPPHADVRSAWRAREDHIRRDLGESGIAARAVEERSRFGGLRHLDDPPDGVLEAVATEDHDLQNRNPFRVLTSGREHRIAEDDVFFIGGRWRFVARSRWWERYSDAAAVVVGHYWRKRTPTRPSEVWHTPGPWDWTGPRGNVFCVDYSVGKRFLHRFEGRRDGFDGGLAALRWPERELVFDDREQPIPTNRWQR